jgi:protein-serine/threonine kinase
MLAGYLPFDDDPANPEGDNINLLYKYIVTTPLTFPQYVTPHARDLLRRILVPDPRKRADLFEVARHSWLSEYAHVVSHITSSTTNVADIANSTVPSGMLSPELSLVVLDLRNQGHQHEVSTIVHPCLTNPTEDHPEPPLLNRSASVREPTRQHQSNISPVGGLSHQQGTVTQDEQAEKPRPQRDAKRRTVQVEYVAPQSQTARGDSLSSPGMATSTSSGARARSGSQPRAELSGQSATRSKPLPQDPPVPRESRQAAGYGGSGGMPPPSRPGRDVPRSVSDSSGAFGGSQVTPTQIPRPNTGGSMTSGGRSDVRLPSRGSYGQPVAPTVAATNAQGKLAQPKNGKQYVISGPISQQQPQASNTSIGRPSTQQLPAKYNETSPLQEPPPERGHKRSNTLSGLSDKIFGRTPSISGNRAQINSPRQKTGKRYPPTSMKEPAPSDNPRQSTDSRRSSFGFGRKKSDLEPTDKSRRFSFIPASFSLRSFSSSAKDPSGETEPEMSQVNDFPQPPSSRGQPRTQAGMVKGPSRTTSYGTEEGMPLGQDGQNERMRNYGRQQPPTQRMNNARPDEQQSYNAQPYAGRQDEFISGPQYQERSYLQTNPTPPVEANNHANSSQHRPIYPEGFNSNDPPAQPQGRQGKGPGVLQKNNRRFADAYEYEQDPTHHAGSSGAARKVMDFFRRRGKARSGDDR